MSAKEKTPAGARPVPGTLGVGSLASIGSSTYKASEPAGLDGLAPALLPTTLGHNIETTETQNGTEKKKEKRRRVASASLER